METKNQRILTVEQLVKLFESKQINNFDYKNFGYKLSAQMPAKLVFENESDSKNLYAKVRVCHTLLNRNGSYISEENMKKAMPSLKEYTPLLAYIHQLDDGTYDFHAHDVEFEEDDDGNLVVCKYLESQIGTFTTDDPYLEYDEENDRTYVVARVAIPKEYTKAAEIIESKGSTKVSCELEIEKCSYNAKERYLDLEDFKFLGCTCLGKEKDGTEIGEGMLGARLDIEDFSVYNNSVSLKTNGLNEVKSFNDNVEGFDKEDNQKGGTEVNKFEELLQKYSKTVEDVAFEYESMTDEELENKFAELFDDTNSASTDQNEGNDGVADNDSTKYSQRIVKLEDGNAQIVYELSHNDIRMALYRLIESYEELDDECYFITDVYDDHFVFVRCGDESVYYGCKYVKDGDSVLLDGERYRLYCELLTESEKSELDNMRANYSEVCSKLNTYEKAEENSLKDEIFNDIAFKDYLETEEFKLLISDRDNYSVEELKNKANILFAECVKKNFRDEDNEKKFRFTQAEEKTSKKRKPYGNIFAD